MSFLLIISQSHQGPRHLHEQLSVSVRKLSRSWGTQDLAGSVQEIQSSHDEDTLVELFHRQDIYLISSMFSLLLLSLDYPATCYNKSISFLEVAYGKLE